MRKAVRFIVSLSINSGKLEEFEHLAQTMIAGTQKEKGALDYEWYFSADHKHCRIIEVYADEMAAVEHVMGPIVQQLVPKLLELSKITRFEVYGDPGAKAGPMLTGVGAEIFSGWRGLDR